MPTHDSTPPKASRRGPLRGCAASVLLAVLLSGCEQRAAVERYTVDKPPPLEPVARANPHEGLAPTKPTGEPTDRTLGAIVPTEPTGWFFKLTGPEAVVAAHEEAFTNVLAGVKFADGKPEWTLPEGWQQRPGNQFRYATLVIPGEPPLELTISGLPNAGQDDANYILLNVNRWRGQLQLPPTTTEHLAGEAKQIDVGGTTATLVNLLGHAAPGGMGGPFSGGRNGN